MNPIAIMINGLPGKVASSIALEAEKDNRFSLVPFSLTGQEIQDAEYRIHGQKIALVTPEVRSEKIVGILKQYPDMIAVDFTHPMAVNDNARFYAQHNIPFVMGTTGGDREALERSVHESSIPAVIAPNMAKQIVGLQAMMEYAAKNFPDLFSGYTLEVRESHQQGKADTSGTAKAMVAYFNGMGVNFQEEQICRIREPEIQKKEWKIPEQYLEGHAWHTYTLRSADGSALFEITHNINGRQIYVEGSLDAVVFLHEKGNQPENRGRVFSMIDVLKKQ